TMDMMMRDRKHGIQLYCKRIFIMEDCKALMPEYFSFVKGVVDAPDLNLNVSREILQNDVLVRNIRKNLVKKIFDLLGELDKEKYEKFYNEFSSIVKMGMTSDFENRDKIANLLRYKTTKSEGKMITLKEYIERMKLDQKFIYYLTGDSFNALLNSPLLEKLKEKDYEILIMTDPVDEWVVQSLNEYEGKQLKSAEKGDVESEDKVSDDKAGEYKDLFGAIKAKLQDKVKEVKASSRLKDSITCLSGDTYAMSAYMEKILRASGREVPEEKRILELNLNHPVVSKIKDIFEKDRNDSKIKDYSELLFNMAVISEGGRLEDPSNFIKMVSELMNTSL
ncbi:MAG: molecular chaperone HtpG, partial [Desulfobacterales bacterium]|nr:molecular chaperone HtpG [Desulfobacterales bacterium]